MATPPPAERTFGATVAVAALLAAGGFMIVMPLVMTAIPAHPLPAPFAAQHQRGETLSYLLAFAVITPAALVAALHLTPQFVARLGPACASGLMAFLTGALLAAVIAVKASERFGGSGGVLTLLGAAALWWLLAAGLGRLAWRSPSWRPLALLGSRAGLAWAAVGALGVAALLCFAVLGSIDLVVLAVGATLAAGVVLTAGRTRPATLPPPWGRVVDLALLCAVLALVPDLVIFDPEAAARDATAALDTGIIQYHQNFLLGPANEVLHGRAMLAPTASQYGVTSIYLLAGWFQLAQIGYGTMGLLAGALTALWFGAGFAILRLVGTSRLVSAGALGIAIVALAYNLDYPVGGLPQSGPLRFGLPMLLVLFAVAAERERRQARWWRLAALATVGLSAIWSFEAFAYTSLTFAALACAGARLDAPGRRLHRLARDALAALAACVAAHAVFALVTLLAAGRLPDWGEYIVYLREFLFGPVGDLTYDVAPWTPGFAVGAVYVVSALAVAELVRREAPLARRERPAITALVGMTTYGIVLMSYYVDRSQSHILMHVSLPAVLTGAIWLGLLFRAGVPAAVRTGGLALALACAVLVTSVAWSSVDGRFPRTALARAAPGGASLRASLDRLWDPPPLAPAVPAAERVLARQMPREQRSLVFVEPDLELEILLRSGRVDRLFLGDPWETSFVAGDELPALGARVDALRPGDRMLVDAAALRVLAALRADPGRDLLADPVPGLARLQQWALQRIAADHRLRPVGGSEGGFTVLELGPRR